jgi:hypothetical protein
MNDLPSSIAEIAESTGLIEQIRTAAVTKEPSKADLKLIQGVQEIQGDALGETAFLARFLVQCTLPHKDPGKVPVWKRKNGAYTLVIEPGWDDRNECRMGYPYGILPRLILIWMVTEAKRTSVRRLHLGGRLADFSHELGLDTSKGGKRSDTARVKDQFARLIMSHISYRKRWEDTAWDGQQLLRAETQRIQPQPIVEDSQIGWWTPGKRALFDSYIDLSPSFFAAIMESAIPFDMRAIKVLRKSPLALDLYLFCNYIGANLAQRGKTKHLLTWRMLGQQLGCDYADQDNLKKKIKAAMRKVKLAHPGLKVGYPSAGGLAIYVSRPAIAPRAKVELG